MRQRHKNTFTEKQLPAISELCKRSAASIGNLKCLLCAQSFPTSKILRRHLGGEMEELALFVLPRGEVLSDDSDSDSQNTIGDWQSDYSDTHCESGLANEDADEEKEPYGPVYRPSPYSPITSPTSLTYSPPTPTFSPSPTHSTIREPPRAPRAMLTSPTSATYSPTTPTYSPTTPTFNPNPTYSPITPTFNPIREPPRAPERCFLGLVDTSQAAHQR